MTKIGVTGPRGRLGKTLLRDFECHALECDILDRESIRKAIDFVKPDVIIHTAALTDVDFCEAHPDLAMKINYWGTANLCREFDGRIIYISTDYVFDGTQGPYLEKAIPFPINEYGKSKFGGEKVIESLANPISTIIRTTILYGSPTKTDFVQKILLELIAERFISVPELWGNPTHVSHLALAIFDIIERKGHLPVINISGTDLLSRGEFADRIANTFGEDRYKISRNTYTGKTPRPIHAGFILDKAKKLGIQLFSAQEGLDLMKKEMEDEKIWLK